MHQLTNDTRVFLIDEGDVTELASPSLPHFDPEVADWESSVIAFADTDTQAIKLAELWDGDQIAPDMQSWGGGFVLALCEANIQSSQITPTEKSIGWDSC